MASKLFKEVLAEVKPETTIFIKKYLDLVERISELMEEQDMTQKELAEALDQNPSAVSRMLKSEGHNMTLRTVAKIEAIFEQDILVVKGRESAHRLSFNMQGTKQILDSRSVYVENKPSQTYNRQSFEVGKIISMNEKIAEAI
jgi:transcriptional regulator with XRE-family HTH domain